MIFGRRCGPVLILFCAFFLTLFPVFSVEASPAYGTKLPARGEMFWGIQHYYIRRRNLDHDRGHVQSRQHYLTLSYGLMERFSLDLKWSLYGTFRHDDRSGGGIAYKNSVWGGGYGFRVRLYDRGLTRIVAGFQHFSIHPATVKAAGVKNNGILEDWQGSCLVSHDFRFAVPYAGVRYALTDYIHWVDDKRKQINSDGLRRLGIITGVDIPLNKKVWANLELEWQDGGAMTGAVHWRF